MIFSNGNIIFKKSAYVIVAVCILLLIIIKLTLIPEANGGVIDLEFEEIQLSIERTDYSIKSDTGDVLAYIYYDKPVLKNGRFSDEINSYFEAEQEGWFSGANRLTHYQDGWLSDFEEDVSEAIDTYGIEVLKEQPFIYVVDSNVIFQNDKYLSIRHIATVQKLGKRSWYYFGSNFDLKTGELISIDNLVDMDVDDFRNSLVEFLASNLRDYNHNISRKELEEVYGSRGNNSYLTEYDGENIDLKYEYYFDEENYYIILNHATLLDAGIIMKWNGKLFDEFEACLIGYTLKGDGTFKLIEYK